MLRGEVLYVRSTYYEARARLGFDIDHTPIAAEHAFTYWAHTSPQSKLERGVVSLPFSLSPVMKIWVYGVEFFPRYSFFVCLQ